jgi:hypothetical protein
MPAIQANFGLSMPRTAGADEYVERLPDLGAAYRSGQQLQMQRKRQEFEEADLLFRRGQKEQERNDEMAKRYGDSLMTNPETGAIDVQASERALQQRTITEKGAFQFGYQYGLSPNPSVLTPNEQILMNTPQGKAGLAAALSKKAEQDREFMDKMALDAALLKQRTDSAEKIAGIRSNDAFVRSLLGGGRGTGGAAKEAVYSWTEPDGAKGRGTLAEKEAATQRVKMAEQEADQMESHDATVTHYEDQLKALREFRAKGVKIDFEDEDTDRPYVEESSMFTTSDDPAEAEAILRKKLEKARKEQSKARAAWSNAGVGVLKGDAGSEGSGDRIRIGDDGSPQGSTESAPETDSGGEYPSANTPTMAKARRIGDLQLAIDEAMAMTDTPRRTPTMGDARRIDDLQLAIEDALDKRNFRRPISVADSRMIDELKNQIEELDAQDVELDSESASSGQTGRFSDAENKSGSPRILGAGKRAADANAKREEIGREKVKVLSRLKEILDSLE